MEETKRIFIGGLFEDITESQLKERLSRFGNVIGTEIRKKKDEAGGPMKTFAYIDLKTTEEKLTSCISTLHGTKWKSHEMKIELAKEHFYHKLLKQIAERQEQEIVSKEKKPEPSLKAKSWINSAKYDIHSAKPGSEVPGIKNWVIVKYGRALPIVRLRCRDKRKILTVDPSKFCHNLKQFRNEDSYSRELKTGNRIPKLPIRTVKNKMEDSKSVPYMSVNPTTNVRKSDPTEGRAKPPERPKIEESHSVPKKPKVVPNTSTVSTDSSKEHPSLKKFEERVIIKHTYVASKSLQKFLPRASNSKMSRGLVLRAKSSLLQKYKEISVVNEILESTGKDRNKDKKDFEMKTTKESSKINVENTDKSSVDKSEDSYVSDEESAGISQESGSPESSSDDEMSVSLESSKDVDESVSTEPSNEESSGVGEESGSIGSDSCGEVSASVESSSDGEESNSDESSGVGEESGSVESSSDGEESDSVKSSNVSEESERGKVQSGGTAYKEFDREDNPGNSNKGSDKVIMVDTKDSNYNNVSSCDLLPQLSGGVSNKNVPIESGCPLSETDGTKSATNKTKSARRAKILKLLKNRGFSKKIIQKITKSLQTEPKK